MDLSALRGKLGVTVAGALAVVTIGAGVAMAAPGDEPARETAPVESVTVPSPENLVPAPAPAPAPEATAGTVPNPVPAAAVPEEPPTATVGDVPSARPAPTPTPVATPAPPATPAPAPQAQAAPVFDPTAPFQQGGMTYQPGPADPPSNDPAPQPPTG